METPIYEAIREEFLREPPFDDDASYYAVFDVEEALKYQPRTTRRIIDDVELKMFGTEKPKKRTAVPKKKRK